MRRGGHRGVQRSRAQLCHSREKKKNKQTERRKCMEGTERLILFTTNEMLLDSTLAPSVTGRIIARNFLEIFNLANFFYQEPVE